MVIQYRNETDSVYQWYKQHVKYDENISTPKYIKDFYGDYDAYCKRYNYRPVSLINFSRAVCQELRNDFYEDINEDVVKSVYKNVDLKRSSFGYSVRYVCVNTQIYS